MLCRKNAHTAGRGSGWRGSELGDRNSVTAISRRRFLKTLGLSGVGAVGLSGYASAIEPGYRLNVTRYSVSPSRWTPGLHLSIGVIADVHAGGPLMPADRIRAIAEHTNQLNPDVIVLLGDFARKPQVQDAHCCAGGMGQRRSAS